jgi:transcriptional regulator with XRE-family HTH domain
VAESKKNLERDIKETFSELRKNSKLNQILDYYAPLNDLILEIVEERVRQNLTQGDLARRLGTRQSAVSRFENLGRKPGFDFLYRVASALGGKLFITIHGRYAALVPHKYREFIDKLAREENKDPETVVKDLLVEAIEQKTRSRESSTGVFAVQESVRKENPAVNPKLEISIECQETLPLVS